jgi:23S rRNA pseudouridine1911/1915/1917 synthase
MHEAETQRQALLYWLLQKYPNTPRARAKQWILSGRVSVGGVVIRKPHEQCPDPGATLELLDRQATTLDLGTGWQIHPALSLLHLDTSLSIVNKAPGLLSVPAPRSRSSALEVLGDFLAGRLRAARHPGSQALPPIYRRLLPLRVHRLDRFTSGLFCLALNPQAREHLIEQVKAHTMKREYIAFVEGTSNPGQGTWRHWVRLSANELHQEIIARPRDPANAPEAQEAITHYEVLAKYPLAGSKGFVFKLRLRLETGLKHQIRVQAAHAGLPLVGDRTYHPGYQLHARVTAPVPFERQALHSVRLELEHPERIGRRISWTAPLPEDLVRLESVLRHLV